MRYLGITLLFILLIPLANAQQCEPSFIKRQVDTLADDWFGLKCDPLDKRTWPEGNEWKNPCDCIKKGEKFSRIKSVFFKKNRKKREDLIQGLLEKKVAEVLRSQIDNGFDQALRLDTLLKQGFISDEHLGKGESFPVNCRISKVDDVIKEAQQGLAKDCNKDVLKKRLGMLLNGKKTFQEYLKEKNEVYGHASMNILSAKDKKEGMCIPYKSFQSLNNKNPYQKTYLTIAKAFGNDFSKFQEWVKDRSNSSTDFDIVGKYNLKKQQEEQARKEQERGYGSIPRPGFGGGRPVLGKMSLRPGGAVVQELNMASLKANFDETNGYEEIDQEAILHLLKTDPVFERMVKDKNFYEQIALKDLGMNRKTNSFEENSADVLKSLVESQNNQCGKLFGESSRKVNVSGRGERGNSRAIASDKEKSLLTQYLCQEDFPAQFVNDNTIKNILAPEFKEEGEIKGLKHTEWIIAKWAYCSEDKVKDLDDGGMSIEFEDDPKLDLGIEPKKEKLTSFLDLSINPKSDLEEDNKGNEFKKFNKTVCGYMPPACKDLDANMVSFECSTAKVATSMIDGMLASSFSKEKAKEIQTQIDDPKIKDKQLRASLKAAGKLSDDQIEAIVTMRNQTVEGKFAKAKADLKKSLGLDEYDDIDEYIQKNGGIDKILESDVENKISADIKQRLRDVHIGYIRDNVYGEILDDKKGSYFSNYFALADSSDEEQVLKGGVRALDGGVTGPVVGTNPSIMPGDVLDPNPGNGGTNRTPSSTDTSSDGGYKRKAFWPTPDQGPVINPGDGQKKDPKPEERTFTPGAGDSKPVVGDAEKSTTPVFKPAMDSVAEAVNGATGGAQKTTKTSDFYLSSSSGSSSSGKGAKKESSDSAKTDGDDLTTKQLEDRLNFLKDKIKEKEDSSLAGGNGSLNPEIQKLRDEVATEEGRLANRKRMQSVADASSRYSGGGSPSWGGTNGFSGNNSSSAVRNNGNYANAYDPLDRASTGRRDLKEPSNKVAANNQAVTEEGDEAVGGGAGGASGKASKKGGAGGSSLTANAEGAEGEGGGVSPSGAIKKVKGSRFPASENGESDPDDLCGYEQELSCYFEYASIDVLSPSVSRFVEYLELQGRSFKAVEVYKYKNNAKPTRYFIHYYEPMENMTKEDKDALYAKSKELLKDYKKNKKELKTIASQVVEVKKTEVTKDEVKELSKSILRVPDLNKLSERRARNQ